MDIAASTYGADDAGLICGFLCGADAGARELDSAQAAQWLEARAQRSAGSEEGFLWLHFNLGHNASRRWLSGHACLPQAFFDTLKDGVHSTRIEREEDTLIAVINDVNFDFSFEPSDISTMWISVCEHLVVTTRLRPLRSVDKLRATLKAGERLRSSAELLARLLRNQANALVDIVREVASKVDTIEDDLLARKLDHKRVRLGALRRLLVRLQRLLAPEPAALFRLLQYPPAWMVEADVQDLRQSSEEFSVVLRDMASLQERIKLLQEEIAARVNEDNGRSLFVLTVVTVLALPINILAGLLGMNVGGVPLAQHAQGFWIVVAIVASITTVAVRFAFRRRRSDG
ncbi:transporter [Piscinibacter sp.]|uniref:transporter n=1 Tax=Piscinibacter sp. TaxID=1903157 RepID=UPI002BBAB210|nr:transporter [Albitalea sp.]HUG24319.1 transporter [Albitalea sp.]